jgi:hypothetical protein
MFVCGRAGGGEGLAVQAVSGVKQEEASRFLLTLSRRYHDHDHDHHDHHYHL